MSDKHYIGKKAQSVDSAPKFDAYYKVVIVVDDETEYSAGDDTGRTLTLENPWGTEKMAQNILASIKGFQYQPYTAQGAILDPAAELGDGVTVNGLYGGIYSITTTYGRLCRAKVAAPSEEELDSEYPYISKSERKIQRKISGISAELSVQADKISAVVTDVSTLKETTASLSVTVGEIEGKVTDLTKEGGTIATIQSTLTQQAGEIEAKVSKTKAGGDAANSFGWTLTDDSWTIKANGINVLVAKKEGLEIEGKITAKTGEIGCFEILKNEMRYNDLTWGGTGYGGYIGQYGIQLGSNFKVDMSGNLEAYSGKFTGSVYAGNIQHGTDTDPVTGKQYGTVSGSALTASTVGTTQTTSGINTSLGYADYANGVFNGWNTAQYVKCIGMEFAQKAVSVKTLFFVDGEGVNRSVQYLAWEELP